MRTTAAIRCCLALAAAAILHVETASAQDCESATVGVAISCITQHRATRLDTLFANDPSHGRLDSRLDGKAWIANEWAAAPFAVAPANSDVSVRASTRHWDAHNNYFLLSRIEDAKAMAPEGMQMPKPVITAGTSALDVWTTLNVHGIDSDAAHEMRTTVGADYRLSRGAVVGMALDTREGAASDLVSEKGHAMAAYLALRPISAFTFDTTAQWGVSAGSVAGHAFDAQQGTIQARMRGNWMVDSFKFAPTLAFSHGTEHLNAEGDQAVTDNSAVTFTPRVSRPIALGNGETLEPFVQYTSEVPLGSLDLNGAEAMRSAGAGMTLVKPDAFSLSLSTNVEGWSTDQSNVKSQIQLKVPLP